MTISIKTQNDKQENKAGESSDQGKMKDFTGRLRAEQSLKTMISGDSDFSAI